MSEVQTAWLLVGVGALFAFVSGVVVIRRFFFSLRAASVEGTVTGLDPGSSGDFPIVSFTPEGHAVAGGRVYTFRSSSTTGSNAIGQKVRVYYDPNRPENATLVSSSFVYLVALLIGVFGAGTCWAVAAMLGLWLGPATEGRDAGVARFLAAVEHGDPSAIRAAAAEGAQLDYAFLARLRGISGFDSGNETLGGGESCIRGMIGDHQITMKVVEQNGEWRVLRAANMDPLECDEDLSGI
jgi:hypothetical protein